MVKVTIIINGSRKPTLHAWQTVAAAKESDRLEVNLVYTTHENHAVEIAEIEANNCDILIAVGGDGTCNEVIRGIYNSGNQEVRFAIIPNGTGNDFARMQNQVSIKEFIARLEEPQNTSCDMGILKFQDGTSAFLNVADIGFGARVVELMNRQRKRGLGGKVSYSTAIVRSFFTYKKPFVAIKGDDFTYEGKVLMVVFCNGTTFGHGLTINPEARIDDGKLNITVIGDVTLVEYIRKLKDLKRGQKIDHPEVRYFETTKVEILEGGNNLFVEGDGELLGNGLQTVSILPNRIKLI